MPRSIWLIIALSVGLAIIIGFDLTPWVRGGYGWRWEYHPAEFSRTIVLIITMLAYVAGGIWIIRHTRHIMLWGIIGTIAISYLAVYVHTGDAFHTMLGRTIGSTTAQHEAAAQLDWEGGEWENWSDYMRSTDGHIALAPPGAVLWYGMLNNTLDNIPTLTETLREPLVTADCQNYAFISYTPAEQASAWFGMLMPLWASLTIFPLAAIARRLTDEEGAKWAVLWWALVPGVAAFASSWNTLYPLLAALAFWMLLRGFESSRLWLIGSGFFTGLALFTNFAFMPLLGVLGVYTLAHYWRNFPRAVIAGVWVGIGILIPWLIFYLPTGQTIFDMLQAALDYHFDLDRPYWFWVGMHIWDFVMWAGAGLMLAGLLAFRHWNKQKPPLMTLALSITLIVMALSGTARGETGRVWLFLAPMLLIAAVDGVRRIDNTSRAFTAVTASHALLSVVLIANLPVMDTDYPKPPPPPMVAGGINYPLNSSFMANEKPAFVLESWYAAQRGDSIHLALQWRGTHQMYAPYWFSAMLIAPDGSTSQPILWQPREVDGKQNRYPTTCWQPNVLFEDEVIIPLPADAPSGDWWISLAAFGDSTQPEGRLQVFHMDTTIDSQVGIGPVHVTEG